MEAQPRPFYQEFQSTLEKLIEKHKHIQPRTCLWFNRNHLTYIWMAKKAKCSMCMARTEYTNKGSLFQVIFSTSAIMFMFAIKYILDFMEARPYSILKFLLCYCDELHFWVLWPLLHICSLMFFLFSCLQYCLHKSGIAEACTAKHSEHHRHA